MTIPTDNNGNLTEKKYEMDGDETLDSLIIPEGRTLTVDVLITLTITNVLTIKKGGRIIIDGKIKGKIIDEHLTGTLEKDYTVPADYTLTESFTVGSGATLTIPDDFELFIPDDYTLTIEKGGRVEVDEDGEIIINKKNLIDENLTGTLEKDYTMIGDHTLTESFTIEIGATLTIPKDITFTVPDDNEITFTINKGGRIIIDGKIKGKIIDKNLTGTLEKDYTMIGDHTLTESFTIESGATLTIPNYITFTVPDDNEITFVPDDNEITFTIKKGGRVQIDKYRKIEGKIIDKNLTGTLEKDYTMIGDYTLTESFTIESGATLTIPKYITFTVPDDFKLTIKKGGRVEVDGEIIINKKNLIDENLTGTLEKDYTLLSDYTLKENLTIAKNVSLYGAANASKLTVPKNVNIYIEDGGRIVEIGDSSDSDSDNEIELDEDVVDIKGNVYQDYTTNDRVILSEDKSNMTINGELNMVCTPKNRNLKSITIKGEVDIDSQKPRTGKNVVDLTNIERISIEEKGSLYFNVLTKNIKLNQNLIIFDKTIKNINSILEKKKKYEFHNNRFLFGDLTIRNGQTVIIKDTTHVFIYKGATLKIEKGGRLIVESNSSLNCPNFIFGKSSDFKETWKQGEGFVSPVIDIRKYNGFEKLGNIIIDQGGTLESFNYVGNVEKKNGGNFIQNVWTLRGKNKRDYLLSRGNIDLMLINNEVDLDSNIKFMTESLSYNIIIFGTITVQENDTLLLSRIKSSAWQSIINTPYGEVINNGKIFTNFNMIPTFPISNVFKGSNKPKYLDMTNNADFTLSNTIDLNGFPMNKRDQQKYLTYNTPEQKYKYIFSDNEYDIFICFDFKQTEHLEIYDSGKGNKEIYIFNDATYTIANQKTLYNYNTIILGARRNFYAESHDDADKGTIVIEEGCELINYGTIILKGKGSKITGKGKLTNYNTVRVGNGIIDVNTNNVAISQKETDIDDKLAEIDTKKIDDKLAEIDNKDINEKLKSIKKELDKQNND